MEHFFHGAFTPVVHYKNPYKPSYQECLQYFSEYLKKVKFLTVEDYTGLDQYWDYYTLDKNKTLVEPGEISQHILFICQGAVKHYTVDENKQHIVDFSTNGHFCTAVISFMNETKSKSGFVAARTTYGLGISKNKYQKLIQERPAYAQLYNMISSRIYLKILERLTSFQSLDAKGRYLQLLQQNPGVFQHFTMLDIANYLGIKPETLSRLRREKNLS